MGDADRDEVLANILHLLENQKKQEGCGAARDTVIEHTKILTELSQNMIHVRGGIEEAVLKIDKLMAKLESHNDRILTLETEKRTWIAMILAIGACLWDFIQSYVSAGR